MFLRKNRNIANGEAHECCILCETVPAELGPRQRAAARLGRLSEQDLAAGLGRPAALGGGPHSVTDDERY
jgi:hypothetical protein